MSSIIHERKRIGKKTSPFDIQYISEQKKACAEKAEGSRQASIRYMGEKNSAIVFCTYSYANTASLAGTKKSFLFWSLAFCRRGIVEEKNHYCT